MMKFDLTKLDVNLSAAVPSQRDMETLVSAVTETVKRSIKEGDPELLSSLCDGIGEIRLRGVCRRLSTSERVEMIDSLLPEITKRSSKQHELAQKLMDTAPNLAALNDTFATLGFDRFRDGPAARWFGERAALAAVMDEIQGFAFLPELNGDPEQAREAIEVIAGVLQHNAGVLEAHDLLATTPMAFNARLLLDAFNEQRWGVEDPVEFACCWNERIKIHTTTGIGVYDGPDLRLSGDELRAIRRGLESFPAYVLTLENVLLRMDFTPNPPERDGALGGYNLGKILLFEGVRGAVPDIHYPDTPVGPVTYATVHEVAHGAHTIGMQDFQKLSGWIRVNNLSFSDPRTGRPHAFHRGGFLPGERVEADSGIYVVSLHSEPETFSFPMGITLENPYNAAESGYLHREGAEFVSDYAASSPEEDYAESLTAFLLFPERLERKAPEKFEFMKFLYGKIS